MRPSISLQHIASIARARDPRALAAAIIVLLGAIDIAFGLVRPLMAPTVFWPLISLDGWLAALFSGVILTALAAGLMRGLRLAWWTTMLVLVQVIVIAPNNHDEWALLATAAAAILWFCRAEFTVLARAPRRGALVVSVGMCLIIVAGSDELNVHGTHRHAARFIRSTHVSAAEQRPAAHHRRVQSDSNEWIEVPLAGSGLTAILFGLRGLMLPIMPRRNGDQRRVRARARRLFDDYSANGVDYFALTDDKTLWIAPNGRGVIGYRIIGTTALAVGDPLCAPADRPTVVDGFCRFCRLHGWTPAFYQTLGETLPCYKERGFKALAIGSEAIIDLPSFTLAGKHIANVRHSVTHAERAGLSVRLYGADTPGDEVRSALRDISSSWLASKGGGELGFTMGQLSADGQPPPGVRVALAYDAEGQAIAFISLVPCGSGRGWMLDLMRRRCDAVSGTMDLLIARTAEALRDEGYAQYSLSLAPLASTDDDDEDAPMPARQMRQLLYDKMVGAYNYRSLFNYKKKFNVRWETRYLIYAGNRALPAALYATARAHLPTTLVQAPSPKAVGRWVVRVPDRLSNAIRGAPWSA